MEVLIVGAGAMGRWIGDVLDASIAITDLDEATARDAAAAIDARAVPLEPAPDEPAFDVVCLAVPMGVIEAAVEAHAPRAEGAVVDVAGVMEPALDAMADHAPGLEHCSLHPLFAPERAPGSVAVVTRSAGPLTDAILDDVADAGNALVETTAAEHDGAMASVQAAAHASVLAFALTAKPVPTAFETPLFAALREQIERLAAGTPRVYADIQAEFDGAESVAAAAERIASADHDELEALIEAVGDEWAPAGAVSGPTDDERRAETDADEIDDLGDPEALFGGEETR